MTTTAIEHENQLPLRRLAELNRSLLTSDHPARVWSSDPRRFHATVRPVALGAVTVTGVDCSPSVMLRTTRLIRRSDPQLYSVLFVQRGRLQVVQAGRKAVVDRHDFTLYDSSRPVVLRTVDPGPTTFVRVRAPLALLPQPARSISHLSARRLPGRRGVGALLAGFATGLVTLSTATHSFELGRLEATALDLLATALTPQPGASPPDSHPSDRERLLRRMTAYVRQHAADPELTPRGIAAAHHISLGHLHRVFRAGDTTITSLIRHRRLEAARRDLSDPGMAEVPIHRIAARSGFRDHTALTRAFGDVYGITPGEFRRRARGHH
ncbi:AraC-like ligand-binding domain-containing protein [Streptomyces sp. SGAir0957]